MEISFAPLEGVTNYIYRNTHHTYFGGIDRYYAPFLDAKQEGCIKKSEIRDLLPEKNPELELVPQILAANAKNFLYAANIIADMGYQEINLNLGCPSRTVVTKGKGAGFLSRPDELDRFFDEVFHKVNVDISVKTRIGISDANEFEQLISIYNQYPIKELIVHPRLQIDYYKNDITYESFAYAIKNCKHKLCYNGDITDTYSYHEIQKQFPKVEHIMIGRGLLMNPGLAAELKGKETSREAYYHFYYTLLSQYEQFLSGERNVLFKMKEVLLYMIHSFGNNEKYSKNIKKSQKIKELNASFEEMYVNSTI